MTHGYKFFKMGFIERLHNTGVEKIGMKLRAYMGAMKSIV